MAAEYEAARAAGAQWIAIRATNGAGAGRAPGFEAGFNERRAEAARAGLLVLGWTQWYGPHDGLVAGDISNYLAGCAAYTARLELDPSGWIVWAEDRDLPGLGNALKQLRTASGLPVFLCAPGRPKTASLNWDWGAVGASIDALMPMILTGALPKDPNAPAGGDPAVAFRAAMVELDRVSRNVPRFPVCDEIDPRRIDAWVREAHGARVSAISFFKAGVPGDGGALEAYGESFASTSYVPGVTPPQ